MHGMGGNGRDWDVWSQVLGETFPSWKIVALQSLVKGARPMASGVDTLAELAAVEMAQIVLSALDERGDRRKLRLHCVGHSMGGIIIRGALPSLLSRLQGEGEISMGHYMSLSSPHLGIRASWSSPMHAWRNLTGPLTACLTPQLSQLCIADEHEGPAYMLALSDPHGPYVAALRRFACRTCVAVADGDALVSLASGIIDPSRPRKPKAGFAMHSKEMDFPAPSPEGGHGRRASSTSQVKHFSQRLQSHLKTKANDLLEVACIRRREGWSLQQRYPQGLLRDTPSSRDTATPGSTATQHSDGQCSVDRELSNHSGSQSSASGCSATGTTSTATPTWTLSQDRRCKYPEELLEGLASLPWRRLVVSLKRGPLTSSAHVFLIAKKKHQWPEEHRMSRACVECLAQALGD